MRWGNNGIRNNVNIELHVEWAFVYISIHRSLYRFDVM